MRMTQAHVDDINESCPRDKARDTFFNEEFERQKTYAPNHDTPLSDNVEEETPMEDDGESTMSELMVKASEGSVPKDTVDDMMNEMMGEMQ